MTGKYSSQRDEALHTLCTQEWANESTGDVAAPTGYVWRISIEPDEINEISLAFPELGTRDTVAALVGEYLVREDDQGLIHVTAFGSGDYGTGKDAHGRARVGFEHYRKQYEDWAAE